MKIFVIVDTLNQSEVNEYLLEEVLFLRTQDIDVRFITLGKEDPNNTLYSENRFTKESFMTVPYRHWWNIQDWKNFKLFMVNEQPNLVITCGNKADFFGRLVAWETKVSKIFVFAHDVFEIAQRKKHFYDGFLSRITDRYIVCSDEAKNKLLSNGIPNNKITLLYDGIVFQKYGQPISTKIRQQVGLLPDDFAFICATSLTPESGVDVLLRAFARVVGGKLIIFGDGPERKSLGALSIRLELSERVIFLSTFDDIPGLLSSSNAMICPSKKGEFSPSIIHGLLSGLPVIATDSPEVRELVKDNENGIIVRRQDSENLAEAINHVMFDRSLYETLKWITKNNLAKFSLSSHAAKLLSLAQKK